MGEKTNSFLPIRGKQGIMKLISPADLYYALHRPRASDSRRELNIMKTRDNRTHRMVALAMMAAIVVLLANTPLGMIQLPVIKATTTHIPVILGAILLGPGAGCILGAIFGICSMASNTVAPTLLSFAFSPFYADGLIGAVKALWISVGCRVLIGFVAGWLWIILKKVKVGDVPALAITGFVGSMTNTVTVMGSIYFLLAEQYAQAREVAVALVYELIMGTITGAGVLEAIVALVLVTAVGKALLGVTGKIFKK